MFDLNTEIADWRTNLHKTETLSKGDIDELESHLRHQIEELVAVNLSQQEAFYVARARLGDTGSLSHEFEKVNGSLLLQTRLFWMISGALVFTLLTSLVSAASSVSTFIGLLFGFTGYSAGVVEYISRLAIMAGLIYLIYRLFPRATAKNWFNALIATPIGKITLLGAIIALKFGMELPKYACSLWLVRTLGARDCGKAVMSFAIGSHLWTILVPLILVVLLLPIRKQLASA